MIIEHSYLHNDAKRQIKLYNWHNFFNKAIYCILFKKCTIMINVGGKLEIWSWRYQGQLYMEGRAIWSLEIFIFRSCSYSFCYFWDRSLKAHQEQRVKFQHNHSFLKLSSQIFWITSYVRWQLIEAETHRTYI